MAQAGVIIEDPALNPVGLPIQVSEYDIQREINAAGSFSVSFPATQVLAKQVRSRWRVSIVEEGRTDYLLFRGIVTQRNYRVNVDGTGILTLAGYSRLYGLTAHSTHIGLSFDGTDTIEDIANDLTGETVTVPASASTITPKVTFSETSLLAALLTSCELARYNLRETFDEDGFELVEQDDVPDSGFRFVNVQQAGPELENAAENGMGLIAGTPMIGYDGKDLATRIIPNGTDFDGKPLTLEPSNKTAPYAIQTAGNPDGSTFYYYIEDDDAVTLSGVVEMQYVRADVKNPSDDAGTRQVAANVLYALTAGEMLKRRYDVVSFSAEIANGRHIDALPGDRVRIQFRGTARTPAGFLTWQDIDQDFLIVKRRDASGTAGVRGVSFTLTAPEVPFVIPDLPDAVPIPPPPSDPPNPPDPRDRNDDDFNDPYTGDDTAGDVPPFEDPGIPDPGVPELVNPQAPKAYQPCCAPPTEINDGAKDPPETEVAPPGAPFESHTGGGGNSYSDSGQLVGSAFGPIHAEDGPALIVFWGTTSAGNFSASAQMTLLDGDDTDGVWYYNYKGIGDSPTLNPSVISGPPGIATDMQAYWFYLKYRGVDEVRIRVRSVITGAGITGTRDVAAGYYDTNGNLQRLSTNNDATQDFGTFDPALAPDYTIDLTA